MGKTDFTVDEHYVPRFYLNRFADNDHRLYQYDVKTEKKKIVSTNNICFKETLIKPEIRLCRISGGGICGASPRIPALIYE